MGYGHWQDVESYVRGPGLLVVLQCLAAIVSIAYTVWKWLHNRRVAVTEYRREVRKKYRWVWRRNGVDYLTQTDPYHADYSPG